MITRIELKNFMSHEHTVIEPARGLTVIAGPNNCGKSAIVTALQILCYNDESTFVTRHGEKECSIKVFTDDGHEIEWIRTKSKSTKYIIDGQQHDRLGRGGTPDDLHKFLQIQKVSCDNTEFDVHFGAQQSPVFLLNDSPRAAAQFFASSSDAINLIGMQTRHKQKVRDRKQEKRRLTVEMSEVNAKLDRLDSVPGISARLSELEATFASLKAREEEIAALHNLTRALDEKSRELDILELQSEAIKPLTAPPPIEATESLSDLIERAQTTQVQLSMLGARSKALAALKKVPKFAETSEMELVLRDMRLAKQVYSVAETKTAVLQPIAAVPEQHETEFLVQVIEKLGRAQNGVQTAQQQVEACSLLVAPPELTNPDGFTDALSVMENQTRTFKKLERKIRDSEILLAAARKEIEEWVEENPSCPTCGSEMTAEQVLQYGHHHE